ncbi:DUF6036 family nucleotidyltransferase [Mycobacterium malmoense]|uniref:DUF6036 family nucleotidyltransferase n=1 Tax=Mycobacterium malmoense TaxID=1780 RepID=UPI0008F8B1EB|nr:DUF6036 family nucleotidyltransferase [Mycobacterium malmoense]OIN82255.1 hypothetical protein BMG05_02980 [Mycobacterium malmoense]
MPEFDPAAILEVLACHEVDYVLIGGYAALLQGSGMATIDIDIVPARPRPNLANLAAALTDLGAKIRAAGTEALPFSASAESLQGMSVLNLTTRFGDLDLLVASLGDVIASKEAAGRDKDFEALPGSSGCSRNEKKAVTGDPQPATAIFVGSHTPSALGINLVKCLPAGIRRYQSEPLG